MRTSVRLVLAACLVLAAAASTHAGSESDFESIEIAPVPGRALLQADASKDGSGGYGSESRSAYGGYSGRRRSLQEGSGGYGDSSRGYGYGAPSARGLMEEDATVEPAAIGAEQEQEPAAQQPQQQREEVEEQKQEQAAAPAGNAAVAAALRSARAAAAGAELSAPAGTCYCRYDPDYSTWALGEEPCKAALAAKCAAGQLPCEWLEAYYGHAATAAGAHALPHEQDILSFVFDDCQPKPPCACAGVKFDGKDAVTNWFACCRDLRAACRTPFNGLACADVDAFCKDDSPSAKLLHWAQHQLHRADQCAAYTGAPYDFAPLAAAAPEEPAAAAAPAPAAGSRLAAAAVGLGGALIAVAVAGMAMTLRAGAGAAAEEEYAAPLLHSIVPEVNEGPRQPLRQVVSSNYLLGSRAPSRSASAASVQQQQ